MVRAVYSVIQYVPDGSRAEAANAGVVLYVPSLQWLEVRTSSTLERIRQFFRPGRTELRRINLAVEGFKHRMEIARSEFKDETDLGTFAAARADKIRITPPRLIMVESPLNEIENLYLELVGDSDRTFASASHEQSLPPATAEIFGRLEAERKIWRPGKITLPTINRSFDVPIAYQNGRVNYVRPESLAAGGKLDDRMAKLGFNGQLIYRHPIDQKDSQLIVLSVDPDANADAENRYAKTLEEFNVRFIRYDDVQKFAHEVEKSAH